MDDDEYGERDDERDATRKHKNVHNDAKTMNEETEDQM
jgi:hypothetical protein